MTQEPRRKISRDQFDVPSPFGKVHCSLARALSLPKTPSSLCGKHLHRLPAARVGGMMPVRDQGRARNGNLQAMFVFLRGLRTDQTALAAENSALRQRISFLEMLAKRPKLRQRERIPWAWRPIWPGIRPNLARTTTT